MCHFSALLHCYLCGHSTQTTKSNKKMRKTRQEIRRLRKDMRAARKDIDRMMAVIERDSRIDRLISEMKQAAREMLIISRGL